MFETDCEPVGSIDWPNLIREKRNEIALLTQAMGEEQNQFGWAAAKNADLEVDRLEGLIIRRAGLPDLCDFVDDTVSPAIDFLHQEISNGKFQILDDSVILPKLDHLAREDDVTN